MSDICNYILSGTMVVLTGIIRRPIGNVYGERGYGHKLKRETPSLLFVERLVERGRATNMRGRQTMKGKSYRLSS